MTWQDAIGPAPRQRTGRPPGGRRRAEAEGHDGLAAPFARMIELRVDVDRMVPLMLGIAVLISAVSFSGQLLRYGLRADFPGLSTWTGFFDPGVKDTVPAGFQLITLLIDTVVMWTVADDTKIARQYGSRHWRLLAVAAAAVTLDRLVGMHALVTLAVAWTLHVSDFFFFAWVLPAILAAAGAVVMYLPFLQALPRRTGVHLLGAVALYLAGTLGLQLLGDGLGWATGSHPVLSLSEAALAQAAQLVGVVALMAVVGRYSAVIEPVARTWVPDGAQQAEQPRGPSGGPFVVDDAVGADGASDRRPSPVGVNGEDPAQSLDDAHPATAHRSSPSGSRDLARTSPFEPGDGGRWRW